MKIYAYSKKSAMRLVTLTLLSTMLANIGCSAMSSGPSSTGASAQQVADEVGSNPFAFSLGALTTCNKLSNFRADACSRFELTHPTATQSFTTLEAIKAQAPAQQFQQLPWLVTSPNVNPLEVVITYENAFAAEMATRTDLNTQDIVVQLRADTIQSASWLNQDSPSQAPTQGLRLLPLPTGIAAMWPSNQTTQFLPTQTTHALDVDDWQQVLTSSGATNAITTLLQGNNADLAWNDFSVQNFRRESDFMVGHLPIKSLNDNTMTGSVFFTPSKINVLPFGAPVLAILQNRETQRFSIVRQENGAYIAESLILSEVANQVRQDNPDDVGISALLAASIQLNDREKNLNAGRAALTPVCNDWLKSALLSAAMLFGTAIILKWLADKIVASPAHRTGVGPFLTKTTEESGLVLLGGGLLSLVFTAAIFQATDQIFKIERMVDYPSPGDNSVNNSEGVGCSSGSKLGAILALLAVTAGIIFIAGRETNEIDQSVTRFLGISIDEWITNRVNDFNQFKRDHNFG